MAALPDSARDLIESGALAHLVTLNADGSPQVSCVWMGIEGDELVAGHLMRQQKIRNIERDPRVTVSFEGTRRCLIPRQASSRMSQWKESLAPGPGPAAARGRASCAGAR